MTLPWQRLSYPLGSVRATPLAAPELLPWQRPETPLAAPELYSCVTSGRGIKVGKAAEDQNVRPLVSREPFHIHSHLCGGRRIIGERKQVHEKVSISRDTRELS